MIPRSGDTVLITPACGAQFRLLRPFLLVVTGVDHYTHTPDHMVYLTGYRLTAAGARGEYRPMLLVEHRGVQLVHRPETVTPRRRNTGPQQRTPHTHRSNR